MPLQKSGVKGGYKQGLSTPRGYQKVHLLFSGKIFAKAGLIT
jgi:hypothetical protein